MTQLILNHHASVRSVKRDKTPSLIVAEGFNGLGFDARSCFSVCFHEITQKGVLFIEEISA